MPIGVPVARSRRVIWGFLALCVVWVALTSELPLLHTGTIYDGYRAQLIRDYALLIPHGVLGSVALLTGPLQFSSRLRTRTPRVHRLLGRTYVVAVYLAAPLAIAISWHRPLLVATLTQCIPWLVTTTIAWMTARNRHFGVHREWMMRSYAVTFTFISTRILNVWPRWFLMSDADTVLTIVLITFGSVLLVDIAINWRSIVAAKRQASSRSSGVS